MSGPFVVQEFAALPGDEVMFVATDPNTGIGSCATNRRESAEADARALNAAYRLGRASLRKLCEGIVNADEIWERYRSGKVKYPSSQDWRLVVELAREIVAENTETRHDET